MIIPFNNQQVRLVLFFRKGTANPNKKDFKVTVYWETAPGKGQAQIDRAIDDLLYVLRRYGSQDAFLKVDGIPVIFVYGRVMGQVPVHMDAHARCVRQGRDM